jgi:hypothetical protein
MGSETMTQVLREHAHEASPAFGLGASLDSMGGGRCEVLGLRWTPYRTARDESEARIIGSWAAPTIIGYVSTDADGRPIVSKPGAEDRVQYGAVFMGSGVVTLSTSSLIGVMFDSAGILGIVKDPSQVAFILPLAELSRVGLMRTRGMFGVKDRKLVLDTIRLGRLFVDFGRFRSAGDSLVSKMPMAQTMATIIAAAAEVQLPGATPERERLVRAALAGQWVPDGDDLMAPLIPV